MNTTVSPPCTTNQVKDVTLSDEVETDIETPFNSPEREANIVPLSSTSVTTSLEKEAKNMGSDDDEIGNQVIKALKVGLNPEVEVEDDDKDYSNWPLHDIKEPHANDVLYGRGGGTNHHPGNKRYRKLVEERKVDYVNSKRLDKPLVALEIINTWRSQVPPGRFLKLDEPSGLWFDVGDKKAREKTSQALREKAPLLRKQQEEQRREKAFLIEGTKNTRFDVPEKATKVNKSLRPIILARDHSLGRDYIDSNDPVSIKDFNWHPKDGAQCESSNQSNKLDDQDSEPIVFAMNGSGSKRLQHPNHPALSVSYNPYPTYSHAYDWAYSPQTPSHKPLMNGWRDYHSDEIARKSYGHPDPNYYQTRSADEAHRQSQNPHYSSNVSPHAQSGDYERFLPESSSYIQNWTSTRPKFIYDPSCYHSPDRMSNPDHYGHGHQSWTSPQAMPPSPQHSMNLHRNNAYTSTHGAYEMSGPDQYNIVTSNSREDIPRPPVVKRDTSHKLQTVDVEPTKKRMNRQSSMSSLGEVTDRDINNLNDSLEQSSLVGNRHPLKKPQTLAVTDRSTTIDRILAETDSLIFDDQTKNSSKEVIVDLKGVVLKPSPLTDNDRLSTLGTIDSDFFGNLINTTSV